MTNDQLIALLKAQIDTTTAAGIVSPQDAQAFIDLSRDQTAILKVLRTEMGIKKSFIINTLAIASPKLRAGVEGTTPTEIIAPDRAAVTLTPVEVILPYDVTYSFLEKNIEGEDVNDTLNKIFAKRFGKDTVLCAFMGDTSLAATTDLNKTLRILDGFVKQAGANADVHDYVIPANPSYLDVVFPEMLESLPKEYRDERDELSFFVSADVLDRYAREIGARATAAGDSVLFGSWKNTLMYQGVAVRAVYGLDTEKIILTLDENLVIGYGRDMRNEPQRQSRERVVEYTITAEIDAKLIVGDALVLGATA